MARVAILLAIVAFFGVLLNCLVGAALGFGWTTVLRHFEVAIPSTIIVLGAWTVVIFYFIGACAWVKERIDDEGAPTHLDQEAKLIRSAALPWIFAAVTVLIAAYVLGGGADSGAVPWGVHLGLATLAMFVHVIAVYRTIVLVGMMLDVQAKTGAPDEA